jgi:hypothetical protein
MEAVMTRREKFLPWRPSIKFGQLRLHSSHDFYCYTSHYACSNGRHWEVFCANCDLHPIRFNSEPWCPCHYDLHSEDLPNVLRNSDTKVDLAALQPCPRAEVRA